ncbi:hypothetical protein FOA52_010811 [Chlamydomonas sp. UWO 241]|nr:hypothetical protein FOA52_010811 [Chlamydomonas sp. UWO 241]
MQCLRQSTQVQGASKPACGVNRRSAVFVPRRSAVAVNAFFDNLFGKKGASKAPARVVRPTIVLKPSFNIPITLLAICGGDIALQGVNAGAVIAGILGVFLTVQATRVKFVFDDEALEVVIGGKVAEGELEDAEETDNVFTGGQNRWTYDSFVNWEMWWPGFPILFFFKETQTTPEGQIHFFPIIFDGKELYDVAVERCGNSQNSLPK